ncbi:MAG: hypothetical protein ACRCUE_06970, partial [Bosea sp. (in: a-proteobacteria)]
LFGVDGLAGEDPCSPTGLVSLEGLGLPPATATMSISDATGFKLQEGHHARHLTKRRLQAIALEAIETFGGKYRQGRGEPDDDDENPFPS